MKHIILISIICCAATPTVISASTWMPPAKQVAIMGKVHSVRETKKYRSVAKCRAFADKSDAIVGFTLDTIKGTCTTYKSIRSRRDKDGSISQEKMPS